jgi:hypothetical protein
MKTYTKYGHLILAFAIITLASCSKEEDLPEPVIIPSSLEVQYANDIVADTGNVEIYTYYSLSENKIIDQADSSTNKWDLAFKGTSVLTNSGVSGPGNGGAIVQNGIFDEIIEAPTSGYAEDASGALAIPTGSNNGWYYYTGSAQEPKHAILPLAGKVILVRTSEGKYAKVEILSYYKGNPATNTPDFENLATRPSVRHYNFKYVFQPSGSTKLN